jgi:hypothetical protein
VGTAAKRRVRSDNLIAGSLEMNALRFHNFRSLPPRPQLGQALAESKWGLGTLPGLTHYRREKWEIAKARDELS